jgi:hypothetical protein
MARITGGLPYKWPKGVIIPYIRLYCLNYRNPSAIYYNLHPFYIFNFTSLRLHFFFIFNFFLLFFFTIFFFIIFTSSATLNHPQSARHLPLQCRIVASFRLGAMPGTTLPASPAGTYVHTKHAQDCTLKHGKARLSRYIRPSRHDNSTIPIAKLAPATSSC